MIPRFAAHSIALSRAVDDVYGELFTFAAYAVGGDVDLPKSIDPTRPMFTVIGTWYAQAQSGEPKARGAQQDDNAHAWIASKPQISIDDGGLQWAPRQGDRVTRLSDHALFEISGVLPEGARRTVFELTARKRAVPVYNPALDFSDGRNSQYLGQVI